jgi:hypothetical protein
MAGSSPAKYLVQIEMTDVQARIVERALDLFGRMGIAQTEALLDELDRLHVETFRDRDKREACRHLLVRIKEEVLDQPRNGNYGIGNHRVSDDAKVAYDLNKTLQRCIAGVEEHHEWSVWHDGNIVRYSKQPVAAVTARRPDEEATDPQL